MFGLMSWLILSVLSGILILWAVWARAISRWRLLSLLGFLASVPVTGVSVFLSEGWATSCSLLVPGNYSLLTYQIIPYDRIYLFLETQYGPRTCYIPWSAAEAEKLDQSEGESFDFNIQWGFGFGNPGDGALGPLIEGELSERPQRPERPSKPENEEGAQF